jgi:hypothetical protein
MNERPPRCAAMLSLRLQKGAHETNTIPVRWKAATCDQAVVASASLPRTPMLRR